MDVLGRDQLAQHADSAALRQRNALAQLDWRGLVRDAYDEQAVHAGLPLPAFSITSGWKRSLHSGRVSSSIARCCSCDV